MLKNRTIAIAILSALLALSQVDAAPAATPLATIRVAAKPTNPLHITHPSGDYDRAFVVQQTGEALIQELHTGNFSARPIWVYRRLDSAAPNRASSPWLFIPTTR
jgi:hypothetical protein